MKEVLAVKKNSHKKWKIGHIIAAIAIIASIINAGS